VGKLDKIDAAMKGKEITLLEWTRRYKIRKSANQHTILQRGDNTAVESEKRKQKCMEQA
jgi:hypothetical protein